MVRCDRSIQFTRRVRRNFDNVGYARAVNCAVGCGLVRVRAASIILYKYGADTHSSSADLLLLSRAARLDRSIPLLIAHATAASNGTASCSDRASRSLAAGCAPVRNFSDPIFGRILPFDASSASQASLAPPHAWICLQMKPASQSHCHLHPHFLRRHAWSFLGRSTARVRPQPLRTCSSPIAAALHVSIHRQTMPGQTGSGWTHRLLSIY